MRYRGSYLMAFGWLLPILADANPAIDMPGYLQVAREAAAHRATRRVSEEEFIRMSREPGTIVLDARSREKYDELHVKGAVNLPLPKGRSRPRSRAPRSTCRPTSRYSYGYRNVYELEPLIDMRSSKLKFSRPSRRSP